MEIKDSFLSATLIVDGQSIRRSTSKENGMFASWTHFLAREAYKERLADGWTLFA
jgi:hypothetical protein